MAFATDYQTVTDTTFNDVDDVLTLTPDYPNSDIQFTATDADQQTIDLQVEQGSPGSGSWVLVKRFDHGSAAIDYTFKNGTGNPVRIVLVDDDGGSNSVSLIEKNHQLGTVKNDRGDAIAYHDKFGTYFPEQVGKNATSEVLMGDKFRVEAGGRAAAAETATFTAGADHVNRVTPITVGASTITVTLPSSTGSGDFYSFLITANGTPSSVIVSCDTDAGAFVGGVGVNSDASGVRFVSDGVNDLFTMNGTTTGGLPGTYVTFFDAATDFWAVQGELKASGAEATPFSGT